MTTVEKAAKKKEGGSICAVLVCGAGGAAAGVGGGGVRCGADGGGRRVGLVRGGCAGLCSGRRVRRWEPRSGVRTGGAGDGSGCSGVAR